MNRGRHCLGDGLEGTRGNILGSGSDTQMNAISLAFYAFNGESGFAQNKPGDA